MGTTATIMGYAVRYVGGITVAATVFRACNDTVLPEEYIGGVLAGGMLYLIGDRMGQREIAKRQLHLDVSEIANAHTPDFSPGILKICHYFSLSDRRIFRLENCAYAMDFNFTQFSISIQRIFARSRTVKNRN